MSQIKTLNGVQYTLPNFSDTGWGANTGNVLTQYIAAIADVTLQLSGGAFTLTAEVDFGSNFGLKALYLKSETANPASAGVVRLAKTDAIKWRNNANAADIALAIDGSDNLQYAATTVLLSGAVVNADINASAAIAYSKLTLTGSVVNADIASAASIALTKLAALTNHSRALASDSSGFITESAVTATELGYVSGVTSSIQTQLNATVSNPLTSNLAAASHKVTGLAAGSSNGDSVRYEQVLNAAGFTTGAILQVVVGTSAATDTTTSNSYQTSALSVSITPKASSSKIFVMAIGEGKSNGSTDLVLTLLRGGSNIGVAGGWITIGSTSRVPFTVFFWDSPATTSSTTYALGFKSAVNGQTVTLGDGGETRQIIAIEVAQ